MKKNFLTKFTLLSLLLVVSTSFVACERKNTEKVISDNVKIESKQDGNLIQKDIELGNKYLQEGKYEESKQSYEKAISLDRGNNQTYLTIKDKYLEKGRLDDAYYIIKLAIKNNVDVLAMNNILAQISGKFEITNIEENSQQNNKYTLPNEVTIKINGVDTKTSIKWNNSAEIDTSKIGDFTYQGNSEQYGRTVKLVVHVTVPVFNGKISGVVKKVYESNGKRYLTVHEVGFYLGDQAKLERKKDGASSEYLDYYIRDKKIEKDYIISDTASLKLLQCTIDQYSIDTSNQAVSYDQFKDILNSKNKQIIPPGEFNRLTLCWLTINNNVVVDAYSQFTP